MEENKYLLGVDIGTTSTKAVLFDRKGGIVAQHAQGYPLLSPTPATAEQDPEVILQAVYDCIHAVTSKNLLSANSIQLVSFSSAMHSVIAVDQEGHALTKSITWADNRSAPYAKKIKEDHNGHDIYRRTGTPIHAMSPLVKLMWMKHELQHAHEHAYKFIGIKEYVFFKLFGEFVVDHSIASSTGMMNLETLQWDEEALALAGISSDRLSTLVPTTHCMKGLSSELAKKLGIAPQTPFVIGASDGVLSNLGVDAMEPGVVAITIGTSGAIRTVSDVPITDEKGRTFCYALTENHWVIGGPVNNGGMAFRWIKEQVGASEAETAKRLGKDAYELLSDIAEKVAPGADGLLFHPYMAGERAPLWNADARGSFFGLALYHKKEHMVRAVLEGVLFNLYSVMLALQELIGIPKGIQATGGFARSPLWRQMMADIFNQEVTIPESFESSCLGAVILGLYALGEIDSFAVVSDMVGSTHKHTPNEEHVKIYQELMSIFLSVSRSLEKEYSMIADFQRKRLEHQES
ncbi:gluconate kinase [Fictibacillus macauensis ZFHKF-1]|uniref:Gluconate kinase n=1 Tax=Fictibacillus macauensis ZFHKF-1 TaxID=1196324 RepID=I8AER7_9BACL|nr:gluconokinase [Fictibacillus macauensis]EIT83834.1 gluconate kinase [Fictibacillus macauensis ZFHKF-1]